MKIDNKTQVVALFTVEPTSLSAAMHNAAFERLNLNYVYVPFKVDDFKEAFAAMKVLNFRGASISIPFKQDGMDYMDEIELPVEKIGAMNTIVRVGDKFEGYNSDWIGAVEALREVTVLKDKRIMLIGAGGAARAIVYGLMESGSEIMVFNRTEKKGKAFAKEFDIEWGGTFSDLDCMPEYDILINATSVGSGETCGKSVIPEEYIQEDKVVMDIVTVPMKTKLLNDAMKKGCKCIPGYRMLLFQGAFQFELFTGEKAPFYVMEEAVKEAIEKVEQCDI